MHRALLMAFTLNSTQPFNTAVQNATIAVNGIRNAVGAVGSDARFNKLKNRLAQEVHNLDAALGNVQMNMQEITFTGWDRSKPVLLH